MLRVPQVDREETGAGPVNLRQDISSFRDQVGPAIGVSGLSTGQVDADHLAPRRIVVSLQIKNVAVHARRLETGPQFADHWHDGSEHASSQPPGLYQVLAF